MDNIAILFEGVLALRVGHFVMYAIGGTLIYLAIKKEYEPMLLLPIGFGAILVNLPLKTIWEFEPMLDPIVTAIVAKSPELEAFFIEHLHYIFQGGQAFKQEPSILQVLFRSGILNEMFPVLIFLAIGAMMDFSSLLKNPKMLMMGAAAQFGIFSTIIAAQFLGFDLYHAAAIGIIGAADGPTAIYVASKFAKDLLGPISVVAYSYMSLVPIIQPPVVRLITTKEERRLGVPFNNIKLSKTVLIIFPIAATAITGIIAPSSVPLIGFLMFGNLIRESGVLKRLSDSAQNELANLVTLLLGITIGSTMYYEQFLQKQTLFILGMGLIAFVFDTAGGVVFVKGLNLFSKEKMNPMVGAAGISAFPMSARVIQKMAQSEDPFNNILMQAATANVAGQIGSVVAGSIVLALVPMLLLG
ncbi:MAG: sodium ion-translocating decarboxylase subunit beta [Desulfobacteraceae bacterium]|jgi:oxaloacetate decarboxylase beta subunit|nr:MAG: sodium ion-translocating decarboxylase subunit beta [Desulfobacteraceae bacterium]